MSVVALIGALFGMPAFAETFQPVISASINHDDNLLRLSDDQAELGNTADTYRSVTGGIVLTRPVGRQTFSGTASVTSVKFDRFSELDYLGKNLNGEWHWVFTSRFEGHVGGSYVRLLAPFADFHSYQRNLRVTRKQYADGTWRFHPSWQLRATYTKYEYAYEEPSQRNNDRTEEYATAGIDYLASSGSTVGLQFRRLKGKYPFGQGSGIGSFGNNYTQDEAKANIMWLATGQTQVLFLGGWVQRKLDSGAGNTNSGTNARLVANWTPVVRLKLVGEAWREFTAIEGSLIDSALNTGSSADATWDFSEKIQPTANLKYERRKFTPANGAAVILPSGLFSDSSTTATVGVAYKPMRNLTLKLNAFRDRRSGSVAAGTTSYTANGASFSVSQQF